MAQITLRFIPYMALATERIVKAQASRAWIGRTARESPAARAAHPAAAGAAVCIQLGMAERMALAMDARGYGSNRRVP
jgi:energy-coupling factor transporter transmembrane protein EcfT